MTEDGMSKKGRRSLSGDDTSAEADSIDAPDTAGEDGASAGTAAADSPPPSVGRRGRRLLPAPEQAPATPTVARAKPAQPQPVNEAAPAEIQPPTTSTSAQTPSDEVAMKGERAEDATGKPGGLGRWRHILQGRASNPVVQPAQTPARDVEISTSAAPTAVPPAPDGPTAEQARPKATPLKRRNAVAENTVPETDAVPEKNAAPEEGAPEAAAVAASGGQTAASDAATTPDPAPLDETATRGAPATMQPTAVDPHAPVLPGASSDSAAAELSPAAASGPQGANSPSTMWQEPQRLDMDSKTKKSLLTAGIAGALLAVLVIGFAVFSVSTNGEVAGPSAGPSITTSTAPKPAILVEQFMLNDADAQLIDPEAGWKVSLTQDGTNAESPQPICVKQNSEGLPTPLATMLRTLTTATSTKTAALHQADSYATADEAQQVFDDRLTQLGTCADSPVYLQSGVDVEGVGDQAGGVVAILQGEESEYHSVVLVRTGKVVNIIDVAQTGKPVSVAGLGKAAASVVDDECGTAVGLCSFTPKASLGVPPLGGDQPGFLAGADLPRITKGTGDWSGTDPVTDITVVGSQCESTDFANVDGPTSRKARTYLLRNDDSAPTNFGIDEVRFTMATPGDASGLVKKIANSVAKCPDRALTAKVKELPKIDGPGAGKTDVKGRSFLVTQKTQGGNVLFRIAVLSVGNKFAYLVLPTDAKFDFTDEQWTAVALRAGQRMSQVR